MDDCLFKPINKEKLRGKLLRWVGDRDIRNEVYNMKSKSNEDTPPLIDTAVLDQLQSIMDDEYIEILQIYLEESINLMTEIHSGFAEDSENLMRFVHTLKSSSKNIGVMRLGFIAEKMEALIRDNKVESARTLLNELQDVFAESHALIKIIKQGDIQAAAL